MTAVYNKAGVYQRDMTIDWETTSRSRVKGTQLYQLGKWTSTTKQYGGDWWPFYVHADDLPEPETKIPGN